MKRYLVLENGKVFEGEAIGAQKSCIAEIVFTTSMTGYLETMTDRSYKGQAVVQTFPLIGNYGIMPPDMESDRSYISGYIVRQECDAPSNFRCEGTLEDFLRDQGIPGISGIDTRSLTSILREHGTMNGAIVSSPDEIPLEKIKEYKIVNPVDEVTVKEETVIEPEGEKKFTVALFDYGVKENIIRSLVRRGCRVIRLPSKTSAARVLELAPDGIFLSNGPGDPEDNVTEIGTLKELSKSGIPMMGICLGHQLLALAHGFKTVKLKYGHRGANHPVKDSKTGKIYISSQNHGYAVVPESIDETVATPLFTNCNDKTNEGILYKDCPAFSVQFHPEACGGPQDTGFLFDEFIKMMSK